MKIFKTTARKIILIIFVCILALNTIVYAGVNPSRQEIEFIIDRVAQKRAIPPTLLKAIARVESCYEHFNKDGSPKICGSNIGLMQVNNNNGAYNNEKLKYDIGYNIEAGADVLLNKWSMSSYNSVSSVGNMDPNIIENWYFALWAYNGWAGSNNPNMISSYAKKYTYQQLIYDIIEKEYDKKINNIDFSYLPPTGKPSRSLVVPTPANINSGDIILYENGDYVRTDGVREKYYLRDAPAGKYIHDVPVNQLSTVVDGPILQNGYYWYKVYINDNTEGWIERNFLHRTGDVEYGRYVFEDISYHWARKIIMDLYGKDIISGAEYFNPDNYVSKEEYCVFLSKSLSYSGIDMVKTDKQQMASEFIENIHPWAVKYVENVYESGLVDKEYLLNPLENVTRKEAALMIESLFEISQEFSSLEIKNIFLDIGNLSPEEISAIKTAYTNGIMSGKSSGAFRPDSYLTRAEAAVIMAKISEKICIS